MRSQTLKGVWDSSSPKSSLFRTLLYLYGDKFTLMWTITLVRCAVSVLPFWFMFHILYILENGDETPSHIRLLTLTACMSISNLLDSVGLSY